MNCLNKYILLTIKNKLMKKILLGALTGLLMCSFCLAVSCEDNMLATFDPYYLVMALPGELIGAIAGILMNNQEKKEENSVVKETETMESKIRGLKNLLDEGLLTQEEFDEQKKKLLN